MRSDLSDDILSEFCATLKARLEEYSDIGVTYQKDYAIPLYRLYCRRGSSTTVQLLITERGEVRIYVHGNHGIHLTDNINIIDYSLDSLIELILSRLTYGEYYNKSMSYYNS